MLLFIPLRNRNCALCSSFQYITCYSLSYNEILNRGPGFVSIHHMLLFIIFAFSPSIDCCIVSIHHMLLFIGRIYPLPFFRIPFQYITCYSLSSAEAGKIGENLSFNTSHVTLYRKGGSIQL